MSENNKRIISCNLSTTASPTTTSTTTSTTSTTTSTTTPECNKTNWCGLKLDIELLDIKNKTKTELEAKIKKYDYQKYINEAQKELDKTQQKISDNQEEITNINAGVEGAREDIASNKCRFTQGNNTPAKVIACINKLDKIIKDAPNQIANVKKTIANLKTKVSKDKKALENAKNQKKDDQEKLGREITTIKNLSSRIKAIQASCALVNPKPICPMPYKNKK